MNQKRERHPFTPEEDKKLRELVTRFGEKNWSLISGLMMNRTVRQCRDRWTNSLCANVVKGEWTAEEDSLLLQLFKEYGSRWKSMEKFFPGRAQYDIRNHCKSILRQKMYAINFLNQKRSSSINSKKNLYCSLQTPKEDSSIEIPSFNHSTTPIPIPIVTDSSIAKSYLEKFDCLENNTNSNELIPDSQKQNEFSCQNENSFNEAFIHEKMLINNTDNSNSSKENEFTPPNDTNDNPINNNIPNNLTSKKSFINLEKIDPILVPFISDQMILGITSS